MTYKGDRMREKKMKRLELALATTSLEIGGITARPPVAETAMRPYLDLKSMAKGVEIVARSKVELLARSIGKWCGDGGATWWRSLRRQWRARRRLYGCESERGRGNEPERADGRIVEVLKPFLVRLVGLTPVYSHQMVSAA